MPFRRKTFEKDRIVLLDLFDLEISIPYKIIYVPLSVVGISAGVFFGGKEVYNKGAESTRNLSSVVVEADSVKYENCDYNFRKDSLYVDCRG